MRTYLSPAVFIVGLFAFYWRAHSGFVPECAGDCLSYTVLMGKSMFSHPYWQAWREMYRSYSVPMIFSFFGSFSESSERTIIAFQIVTSFAAWIVFAWALSSQARGRCARRATFALVALLMYGRGYYFANQYLWSDSLALTLMLLWYAAIVKLDAWSGRARALLAAKRWTKAGGLILGGTLAFAAATSLASNSRDANVFLIFFTALPLWLVLSKHSKAIAAAFVAISCAIGFAQIRMAGPRAGTGLGTVLVSRIMNDPERRTFFVERGMPTPPNAERWLAAIGPGKSLFASELESIAPFPWTDELLAFLQKSGKRVYFEYLLTHPQYVVSMALEQSNYMLAQREVFPMDASRSRAIQYFAGVDALPLIAIFLITAAAIVFLASRRRLFERLHAFGLFFVCVGYSNALIAFLVDSWAAGESSRHCFIGSVLFRVGCCILIAGAGAEAAAAWQQRRRRHLASAR